LRESSVEISGGSTKHLTLFGVKGYVNGKSWVMNVLSGVYVQVVPCPAGPDIELCIETDFDAGNGDKIDHISVNPNTGVRLYLEGRITRNALAEADV